MVWAASSTGTAPLVDTDRGGMAAGTLIGGLYAHLPSPYMDAWAARFHRIEGATP